jgi:hypothetical protein
LLAPVISDGLLNFLFRHIHASSRVLIVVGKIKLCVNEKDERFRLVAPYTEKKVAMVGKKGDSTRAHGSHPRKKGDPYYTYVVNDRPSGLNPETDAGLVENFLDTDAREIEIEIGRLSTRASSTTSSGKKKGSKHGRTNLSVT